MAVSISTIMIMTGTDCLFPRQIERVFPGVRLVDEFILYFVRLPSVGSNRNSCHFPSRRVHIGYCAVNMMPVSFVVG